MLRCAMHLHHRHLLFCRETERAGRLAAEQAEDQAEAETERLHQELEATCDMIQELSQVADPTAAGPAVRPDTTTTQSVDAKAVLLYDFTASAEGQLSSYTGEQVVLREPQPQGEWWLCSREGQPAQMGWIPAAYLDPR